MKISVLQSKIIITQTMPTGKARSLFLKWRRFFKKLSFTLILTKSMRQFVACFTNYSE